MYSLFTIKSYISSGKQNNKKDKANAANVMAIDDIKAHKTPLPVDLAITIANGRITIKNPADKYNVFVSIKRSLTISILK